MKRIWRAAIIAGFLGIAGGQQAGAQQAERIVTFKAPFAFQLEQVKLPAGEYTILEQSGWVQIQAKNGKGSAQVLALPVVSHGQKAAESSQVVFHNYAGRMFLAQIWATGQDKGRELIASREEQQLAKKEKMAKVSVPVQTVAAN